MASVDFKKCNFSSGAAMVGHFTRHDGREGVEYRNKYIQPELSGQNYIVGLGRFENVPTSAGIMEQMRERVRQVDEVQPPRRKVKDRVTVMTYTIAAPEGLTDRQERAFFAVAYDELARFSGGRENVSPGFVHRDEIHDYIGTDGQRTTSRAHMHVAGVPYTEEKGINGKAFETRTRMRELNRAIDERCRRELGIRFMTGEKGLTGRTVEELQAASDTRAKRQERARLNAELADAEKALSEVSKRVRETRQHAEQLQQELGRLERIRAFCEERIRSLRDRGKKILSSYTRLRNTVEQGAYRVKLKSDDVSLEVYELSNGRELYAPTCRVTGELVTWDGKAPLYELSRGDLYSPAYVMDTASGRIQPAEGEFGEPGAWEVAFNPERRTLCQAELDTPDRVVLSDRLQAEVSRCQDIIADIDALEAPLGASSGVKGQYADRDAVAERSGNP